MQLLVVLIFIVTFSFRGLPAASIAPNILINASYDEFWMSSMDNLHVFFSRLDNIIGRVKGREGERFSTHIPYINDTLSEAVSVAINTLDMEKINEILAEGNGKVIETVLEKGLKYCFKDWSRINLFEIPWPLLSSFPIEFLPIQAYSILSIESIVECVLARVEDNKFKNFHSLIPKLDREFWNVPRVRSNFNLRFLMTGFHLGTFSPHQIPITTTLTAATSFKSLEEIYASPQCHVLEFILNLDILNELEREYSISDEIYAEMFKQFPFYFYILQTFLHEIASTNSQAILRTVILNKSISLQETIELRIKKFPSEERNLMNLKYCFMKCFSEDLNLSTLSNFFSISGVEVVDAYEIINFLSPVINRSNPELILNVFIMTTKEGSSVANNIIQSISEDLVSEGKILEPFKQNSNIIFSFSNCLRRNRFITETIRRNFGLSKARARDVYILSRILANDFEHLKTILIENERGIQRQFKFSTIFAGAFIDSASVSHDPESRFNHHTRARNFSETTCEINQVGKNEKFGAKMKQKQCSNEAERLYRGRNGGFLKGGTEATAKALFLRTNPNPRMNFFNGSMNFWLPNISIETASAVSSDEYIYVNQLKSRRRLETLKSQEKEDEDPRNSGTEPPNSETKTILSSHFDKLMAEFPEIRFIYSMMAAMGKSMIFPSEILKIYIEGSSVSGDGILKDSLATFGHLISLPKLKTVEFKEGVDGFVPFPLLCPNVMGFLGAWTALCLKHEVPLPWSFASIFRKFLYRAIPPENETIFVDEMIETIFGDLFDQIKLRFLDQDTFNVEILPRIMKSHRMLNLPPPLKRDASPFLFENRFLETQNLENSVASLMNGEGGCKNVNKYLSLLKYSIKKHLYDGRDEFMRYFSVYFKSNFLRYLRHSLIDEFVGGNLVDSEDVSASLYFSGIEIPVVNDFEGESEQESIYPMELMKKIISKFSQEQVGKFLWFVSGSSLIPLNGFGDYRIAFDVKESSDTEHMYYSVSRVCFKKFTLIIHKRSAKETFEKFVESITMSAGFSAHEV